MEVAVEMELAGVRLENSRDKVMATTFNSKRFYAVESVKTGHIVAKFDTRAEAAKEAGKRNNSHLKYWTEDYKVVPYDQNPKGKVGPISSATRMITGAGEYIMSPVKRLGGKVDRELGRAIGHNPGEFDTEKAAKAYARLLEHEGKKVKVEKRWGKGWDVVVANPKTMTGEKFGREAEAKAYKRLVEAEGYKAKVEFEPDMKGPEKWVVKVAKGNPGKRKNPESEAAEMFEKFHGKASESIATFEEEEAYHGHLAALGQLIELKVYTVTGLEATFCFEHEGKPEKGVILASNESGSSLYFVGGCQKLPLKDIKMDTDEWLKDSMIIGDCFFVSYYTEKDFDKWTPTIYEHQLGEETGDLPVLRYDKMNERIYLDGGAYVIKKPLFRTSDGIEN